MMSTKRTTNKVDSGFNFNSRGVASRLMLALSDERGSEEGSRLSISQKNNVSCLDALLPVGFSPSTDKNSGNVKQNYKTIYLALLKTYQEYYGRH